MHLHVWSFLTLGIGTKLLAIEPLSQKASLRGLARDLESDSGFFLPVKGIDVLCLSADSLRGGFTGVRLQYQARAD